MAEWNAPYSMRGAAGDAGSASFAMAPTLANTVRTNNVQATFFSQANVDALQEGLRYGVYQRSGGNHVIGRQSDVELGLIMRSIYLQEGRNDDAGDVIAQVRALNASVLAYAVPRVLSEVDAYSSFRRDISTLVAPMERGQNVSSKGERTLDMRGGFL